MISCARSEITFISFVPSLMLCDFQNSAVIIFCQVVSTFDGPVVKKSSDNNSNGSLSCSMKMSVTLEV